VALVALAVGVVALVSVASLALFFAVGKPFGAINMDTAPGWVWIGFIGWLGIFFLYPIWSIWLGSVLRKNEARDAAEQT
jgi:hypothetical protein